MKYLSIRVPKFLRISCSCVTWVNFVRCHFCGIRVNRCTQRFYFRSHRFSRHLWYCRLSDKTKRKGNQTPFVVVALQLQLLLLLLFQCALSFVKSAIHIPCMCINNGMRATPNTDAFSLIFYSVCIFYFVCSLFSWSATAFTNSFNIFASWQSKIKISMAYWRPIVVWPSRVYLRCFKRWNCR